MDIETIIKNRTIIKKEKAISGVYFLISKEQIVYVGTSCDIMERIKAHQKKPRLHFDSYSYIEIKDTKERKEKEIEYIKTLRPLFNFADNPDYEEGKKELLLLYLRNFTSTKEISMLCGVSRNYIINLIYGREGVPDHMKEKIVSTLRSRGSVNIMKLGKKGLGL